MSVVSACWGLQGRVDCPLFSADDKSAAYTHIFHSCTSDKRMEEFWYMEFGKLCTGYYQHWAASPPDQISAVLTQRCQELNQLAKFWCDSIYSYLGRYYVPKHNLPPLKHVLFTAFSKELATERNVAMLRMDVFTSLNNARRRRWYATTDAAAEEDCSGSETHPNQRHDCLLRHSLGILMDIGRKYTYEKNTHTHETGRYRMQYSLDMFTEVLSTHLIYSSIQHNVSRSTSKYCAVA